MQMRTSKRRVAGEGAERGKGSVALECGWKEEREGFVVGNRPASTLQLAKVQQQNCCHDIAYQLAPVSRPSFRRSFSIRHREWKMENRVGLNRKICSFRRLLVSAGRIERIGEFVNEFWKNVLRLREQDFSFLKATNVCSFLFRFLLR